MRDGELRDGVWAGGGMEGGRNEIRRGGMEGRNDGGMDGRRDGGEEGGMNGGTDEGRGRIDG